MHWLLVSARDQPDDGGIGAYVTNCCDAAEERGWHVELVTRAGGWHPRCAHVHEVQTADMAEAFCERIRALRRIERIRPYRYGLWSLAVAEKLLELESAPDVVEFIDCQAEGYVALGCPEIRRRWPQTLMIIGACGPMFVAERLSGFAAARFGRSIYHEWEGCALRLADGVVTPSAWLRRLLPGLRCTSVIPNPVAKAGAWPRAEGELILMIAPVEPNKSVDVWARSLNIVLRQRRRARAVLIGADTFTAPDGGSMAGYVEKLVERDIRGRFEWRGEMAFRDVLKMMEAAAVIVVPSGSESFSYVAADATVRGRPVIVSDGVGLLEHAPSLVNVAVGDVGALAGAQMETLADPDEARLRAMSARAEILAHCSYREHLTRKQEFVAAVRTRGSASGPGAGLDHRETMRRFLGEVEALEQSECGVSGGVTR